MTIGRAEASALSSSLFPLRYCKTHEESRGDVTNIPGLRVAHTPLPQHIRSVPGDQGHAERDEEAEHPSEHAPAPRQGEDGEADIFAEQQKRRRLPAQSLVLDIVIGLLDTEFCDGLERDITGLEVVVVVVDGGGGRLLGRSRCCPLYLSCRLLSV